MADLAQRGCWPGRCRDNIRSGTSRAMFSMLPAFDPCRMSWRRETQAPLLVKWPRTWKRKRRVKLAAAATLSSEKRPDRYSVP